MVLSDVDLAHRFKEIFPYSEWQDFENINPASVDVSIGNTISVEIHSEHTSYIAGFTTFDIGGFSKQHPMWIEPGEFILVALKEHIKIPNDLVMEFKLKSSRAREGYDHSLAFWVDPGWDGILTLEIKNNLRFHKLPIYPGLKIGQAVLHKLTEPCFKPYSGKYQGAKNVEQAKGEKK